MTITPDLLLTILFVAIIVNSALIALALATGRRRRRQRETALEQTLATSYVGSGLPATGDAAPAAEAPVSEATAMTAAAAEPTIDDDPDGVPAGRDALTGMLDAASFGRLVALEEARIARYHRPATIAIFELDGLERLAEKLGSDAGDRVVVPVADTIGRLARSADRAARLGPSRFAVLLTETDEVAAINYVERVRRACELWLESSAIALRLAVGWAGTGGDPTLTETQRIAIDRLYAELRRGARRGDGDAVGEAEAAPALSTEPTRIAS